MGLGAPPGGQLVPPNPRLALPPSPAGRGQGLVTHGSGECMGEEAWRMYWVHWNTRKARLARKSRADSRPATGRSWKPVRSAGAGGCGRSGHGGWRERRGWPGAGRSPGDPARAPHPSGSGRRPPAAGFGPRGTRRSAPASRRPPGAHGRRGWGTGPAAWSRPPSCGPGAQAGACPDPPRFQQCRQPVGSALPPAGPGSLALQASHWPEKLATGRGFGGLGGAVGAPGSPPSPRTCLSCWRPLPPHGVLRVLPGPLCPPGPPLPRTLTRWRSPRPCTPRGGWGRL